MEITETVQDGLKRELNILIPKNSLREKQQERLLDVAKSAKINGFRPGKVPLSYLEKIYGRQVMLEVIEEQLEEGGKTALAQKNLKPAYRPDLSFDQDQEKMKRLAEGQEDLSFTLSFEIMPSIELIALEDVSLSQYAVEPKTASLEEQIEKFLSQHRLYHEISEAAQDEDRLTVRFVGKIDGKAFEGGTAEDIQIVLGSKRFIPGFEEQLLGIKVGEARELQVTFPADYAQKTLAGREAVFEVNVSKVERAAPLAIDDEAAKRAGFDSLEALREGFEKEAQEEFSQVSHMKLRKDLLDVLDQRYSFDLPTKLVEEEFARIRKVLETELEKQGKKLSEQPAELEEQYRKLAQRRVRLGLVFNEIGEKAALSVTSEDLQKALLEEVRKFPGREYEVYQYYRKNPRALSMFHGPIFEKKVIDHLLTQIKTIEVPIKQDDFETLIKKDEEEESRLFAVLDGLDGDHSHHHDHDHDHHDHHHG